MPASFFYRETQNYLCCKFHCYIKCSSIFRKYPMELQYKYTVFTSHAVEPDDVYEGLPEVKSSSIVDRVIEIPYDKCKPKGQSFFTT